MKCLLLFIFIYLQKDVDLWLFCTDKLVMVTLFYCSKHYKVIRVYLCDIACNFFFLNFLFNSELGSSSFIDRFSSIWYCGISNTSKLWFFPAFICVAGICIWITYAMVIYRRTCAVLWNVNSGRTKSCNIICILLEMLQQLDMMSS